MVQCLTHNRLSVYMTIILPTKHAHLKYLKNNTPFALCPPQHLVFFLTFNVKLLIFVFLTPIHSNSLKYGSPSSPSQLTLLSLMSPTTSLLPSNHTF